jgi:N-acetylmuramoyl-L-alanine amidase
MGQKFSEAQITSLMALLSKLKKEYNIPTQNIIGHSDIALVAKRPKRTIPLEYISRKWICGKMIFYKPPLSILILNRRYALSDMTLKIFPAIKAFKLHFIQKKLIQF